MGLQMLLEQVRTPSRRTCCLDIGVLTSQTISKAEAEGSRTHTYIPVDGFLKVTNSRMHMRAILPCG